MAAGPEPRADELKLAWVGAGAVADGGDMHRGELRVSAGSIAFQGEAGEAGEFSLTLRYPSIGLHGITRDEGVCQLPCLFCALNGDDGDDDDDAAEAAAQSMQQVCFIPPAAMRDGALAAEVTEQLERLYAAVSECSAADHGDDEEEKDPNGVMAMLSLLAAASGGGAGGGAATGMWTAADVAAAEEPQPPADGVSGDQ